MTEMGHSRRFEHTLGTFAIAPIATELLRYVNRRFGLRFDTTYLTTECVVKRYVDRPSTGSTIGRRVNVG